MSDETPALPPANLKKQVAGVQIWLTLLQTSRARLQGSDIEALGRLAEKEVEKSDPTGN
ncbi:hypothetical protein QM012_007233 [Aureobasidium pullulans]|uniref:Uncharacterized protein n=1 Tax=Aureobasidium pullulans TaxID=5580 RepID=A0ABR0TNB4_AURPU